MAVIHVLDQDTINQIAAGEVVERPASIVKELVENAVDACSTAVTIEIKGGGIDFIRITDNGSGIDKEQIRKAFLRHATSKITSAEDLETVGSLGFRGEALSSIAAVAKVEVITKTDEGISGVRYVTEGGEEIAFEEIGCPEGTTFVVRNLFYNTPARRKFLKSAMTESGYVEAFVQRLALSHPDISFKFICDNKNKIATSGNGNLKDVIYHLYGRDIAMNLLEVHFMENGISIDGFVGKPVISRGNRNYENYFVNGRYLKNTIITRGIEEGYKGHSMVHKFPFTALMISMDPHLFDVNVHPAKMEMRFKNGEELYSAIVSAVRESFVKKELIPKVSLSEKKGGVLPERKKTPEPFERKRREIEARFSGLSQERINEINRRKREEETGLPGTAGADSVPAGADDAQREAARKDAEQKRIASLGGRELPQIKKEIDQAIAGRQQETPAASEPAALAQDGNTLGQVAKAPAQTATATAVPAASAQDGNTSGQVAKAPAQTGNAPAPAADSPVLPVREDGGYAVGEQMSFADVPLLSKEARPKHRLIGQVFQTYWIVEYEDQLFFVDQHAAHEKVMYERLKKNLEEKQIDQQMVAPPIILTFSIKEKEKYLLFQDAFAALGYQIEEFGGDEYCIRAVPANLFGINQQDLFIELFDSLDEGSSRLNLEVITDKLASMACKAAVKGNQKMSFQEMDSLMDQLLELENPYQCPHGRPTIISMTKRELEKKFKRIV